VGKRVGLSESTCCPFFGQTILQEIFQNRHVGVLAVWQASRRLNGVVSLRRVLRVSDSCIAPGRLSCGHWPNTNAHGLTTLVVEQVSHRPLITAFYIANASRGITLQGHNAQRHLLQVVASAVSIAHPKSSFHRWRHHREANRSCHIDSLTTRWHERHLSDPCSLAYALKDFGTAHPTSSLSTRLISRAHLGGCWRSNIRAKATSLASRTASKRISRH
jgi:hypothetical protein